MRKKRLPRFFIPLLLLFLLSPSLAWALNNGDIFTTTTVEGVSMRFQVISTTANTCRVYGSYNSSTQTYTPAIDDFTSGKVTIPSSPSGYSVVEIGSNAFYKCEKITVVSMPSTVKTISYNSFYGCVSLTSITGMTNVENISSGAFGNTPWQDNLPEGLVYVGKVAFMYKGTMPENTTIDIKDGTISIASDAFYNQSNLVGITIPKSVTNIYDNFSYCYNLSTITVSSNNTVYDSRINCNAIIHTYSNTLIVGGLKTVIPSTVKSISGQAFRGRNITSINIPNNVETMYSSSINNCPKLESVTIGSGLKSNGYSDFYPFYNCPSLKSITVSSSNSVYDSRNNCNAIIETSTNKLVAGCSGTVIPSTVKTIGYEAFWGNGSNDIYSITIPNTVEGIENYAFENQSNLVSVTIGSGITTIGNSVFLGCNKLKSVHSLIAFPFDISENVFPTTVYENATLYVPVGSKLNYQGAAGWSKFANIVEVSGNGPFDGDVFVATNSEGKQLIYQILSASAKTCEVMGFKGTLSGALTIPDKANGYSVVKIGDRAFYGYNDEHQLTSVTIPASVKELGINSFYGSRSLTSVTFLGGITKMGNYSFSGCENLKKVIVKDIAAWCATQFATGTSYYSGANPLEYAKHLYSDENTEITSLIIPEGVTTINAYAFYYCEGLTSVSLPTSLRSVQRYAFAYTDIKSVEIPALVEEIGTDPFRCSNLETISVDAANTTYDSRDGCNAIIHTATNTLVSGCKNTTIPNTVVTIGTGAFHSRKKMTSIRIPNSVNTIMGSAFRNTDLTSVTIPTSVTSIGAYAFAYCDSLTDFVMLSENPFDIAENVFLSNENVRFADCTLWVPVGCKSKYEQTSCWNMFENIVEGTGPIPPMPGDLNDDELVNGTDLVMLTNMILGKTEEIAQADMNGDDLVNGTDYVAMVNHILGISPSRSWQTTHSGSGNAQLTMMLDEEGYLLIGMNNAGQDITLVQCDLLLPQGLFVEDEADMGSRTTWRNHQLSVAPHSQGVRLLLSSASNTTVSGSEGTIARLRLKTDSHFAGGSIMLTDALCVSPSEEEIQPETVALSMGAVVTGIDALTGTATIKQAPAYDMQGRKAAATHKGLGIVNGQKVIMK